MDIAAVQTEGQTKATAWLTQALAADPTTVPEVKVAPVAPVVPVVAPVVPNPAVVAAEPVKPGLADVIRRDRESRAAAAAAQSEAGKYKGELEALRKENADLKGSQTIVDPLEFLRVHKMTKEQQALWGQAFLYDLKPEVAPQEFRLELYKAEQAKVKEQERIAAQQAQTEQAQQQERAHLERYSNDLIQYVTSSTGSNPESELWFTEEADGGAIQVDHRAYAQSLFATANNLANTARKAGQQADLSPANVARVLEAEVAKRQQRRDAKRASSAKTPVTPGVPAQGGTQATISTATSAEGLRSGAPTLPDMSDEARRARAIAAGFGGK